MFNFDLYQLEEHPLCVPKKGLFFASCFCILAMKISKSTCSIIQIHVPHISIRLYTLLGICNNHQKFALTTSGITNRYLVNSCFYVFFCFIPP